MLSEIRCDKFKEKSIEFHRGLNVILGDEVASNSIGKSSLLMVLDFAFGGKSLLEHNSDIVKELGDHEYLFVFDFGGEHHAFKRSTTTPDLVYVCDQDLNEADPLAINEYTAFLKSLYKLDGIDLTFRSIVSLFSRVWGKDNLDVKQPLHSHKKQRSVDSIDNLIRLYERYESIETLSLRVKSLEIEKKSISSAYKQKLIPKINKTNYTSNLKKVTGIDKEISEIKENLARFAVSIREIVDREISELKLVKDTLLQEKSKVSSRLQRVRNDLSKNKYVKSKAFQSLTTFFPEANVEKFAEVEEFHSRITQILKVELKESEKHLSSQLDEINTSLVSIDDRMREAFSNINNPSEIIDRVHSLAKKHNVATREIEYFEHEVEVSRDLKAEKTALKVRREKVSNLISDIINNKIRKFVNTVYDEHRQSPQLTILNSSYSFSAIEDTGTGKAYSSLILLDLAVLDTTNLPFLIHDSVLFKNIENGAVANLVKLYDSREKQTFIAIDEIQKYGGIAEATLVQNKVIQLTNDSQLYVKDWRK
ncbi:DUF2326 domain-containing protein [Ruegeria litorea]|uniref:DUF2326 domain-containing protein n=1 Tax=Falsiruegeria litorea TaxID=1280831 RepID=A0ABS5WNV0_9RHOB|nr:DUF2326 domain-containing protein [Falsiruegeria litorea]MBT3140431.1 DUF2326 domain-containing protein [Falsiruegeria litorea]